MFSEYRSTYTRGATHVSRCFCDRTNFTHQVSSEASEDGHMAFNYWFHPPDSLGSASAPYKSSFWQRDWEAREREAEVG